MPLPGPLDALRQAVQHRGFVGTLLAAPRGALRYLRERSFDRRYGVDTYGEIELADLPDAPLKASGEVLGYMQSNVNTVEELLRALPITPAKTVFVDLGCGKGRTMLVASAMGFMRSIGVEHSPSLAAVARHNADIFKAKKPLAARVEVIEGDATTYRFPANPIVLYLFNPFKGRLLEAVLDNAIDSMTEQPRPFYILYVNPEAAEVFARRRELQRLDQSASWHVYQVAPRESTAV
jgi:SAM-dependent methyltransferase